MKKVETWNTYMTIVADISLEEWGELVALKDFSEMQFFNLLTYFKDTEHLEIKLLSRTFDAIGDEEKLIAIAELTDIISILTHVPYAATETYIVDVDEYDETRYGLTLTIEAGAYRIIDEIIQS